MTEIVKEKPHIDAIICWPKSTDYPLFRDFIEAHRHYFDKVIIVFTETNQGHDYKPFVREALADADITFLDSRPIEPEEDWRNVAVNQALDVSESTWVWFLEQDFMVTNHQFWNLIVLHMLDSDAIGWKDGATRLHPACLLVKRQFINMTHRDFGIVPGKLDHFARFFTSLRLAGAKIQKLDYPSDLFYHMNGLSHNMALLERGEEITYKPEEFYQYLALCLAQPKLHDKFREIAEPAVQKYVEAQQ